MTTRAIYLLVLVLACACSKREERERALHDLERIQQEQRESNELIERLKADLNSYALELEVAKDDLEQVKQFQFLRAEIEREQQIRDAKQRIIDVQKQIDNVSSRIRTLSDSVLHNQAEILRLKDLIKG
jgi:hypothetical protein